MKSRILFLLFLCTLLTACGGGDPEPESACPDPEFVGPCQKTIPPAPSASQSF